jgi:uncharacterized membrane protein YdjX (TVP38/TMEM64 family)
MARRHEEWLRDVYDRQRNTVFPDTAANEARFWRNLFNGTRTLSGVQIAGVLVLAVAVLALVVGITIEDNGGSVWGNISGALVRWVLAFAILAGFLIVFGFARKLERRRALMMKTKPAHHSRNTSNHAS